MCESHAPIVQHGFDHHESAIVLYTLVLAGIRIRVQTHESKMPVSMARGIIGPIGRQNKSGNGNKNLRIITETVRYGQNDSGLACLNALDIAGTAVIVGNRREGDFRARIF